MNNNILYKNSSQKYTELTEALTIANKELNKCEEQLEVSKELYNKAHNNMQLMYKKRSKAIQEVVELRAKLLK